MCDDHDANNSGPTRVKLASQCSSQLRKRTDWTNRGSNDAAPSRPEKYERSQEMSILGDGRSAAKIMLGVEGDCSTHGYCVFRLSTYEPSKPERPWVDMMDDTAVQERK